MALQLLFLGHRLRPPFEPIYSAVLRPSLLHRLNFLPRGEKALERDLRSPLVLWRTLDPEEPWNE